ncbi:hypothetical protein CYG49_01095 [Candidatus Saccharibacteria bacterium]|nr:MAG: hypothetical protein CYG49_01095 [Candidatus Saccharibacteria bacterium]
MDLIIGGVVILLLATVSLLIVRASKIRRREREAAAERRTEYNQTVALIQEWVERMEAAESDEDKAALPMDDHEWQRLNLSKELGERFTKARAARADARVRVDLHKWLANLRRAVEHARDDREVRVALFNLVHFVLKGNGQVLKQELDEEQIEQWRSRLSQLATVWFNQLVAVARDDSVIFRQDLFPFIAPSNRYEVKETRLTYDSLRITLSIPDDWNDMVARHYVDPVLQWFTGESTDEQSGVIRLRAAKALRTRSLTEAKIVLAYCNVSPRNDGGYPFREALGCVLLARVTEMAERLAHELKLADQ